MAGPVAALTADGRKLHLQHGPIDLVITADGPDEEVGAAFAAATVALGPVLDDLVAELATLRRPSSELLGTVGAVGPVGPVAQRMFRATSGFDDLFVTPMAAVAGAVADHVLAAAMRPGLRRLTVNNGGDIAFALAPGASTVIGVMGVDATRLSGQVTVHAAQPIRGVATSGWRGRSHSLGIADAVTVFAEDAAAADAAASLIASAVDLPGHPAISRTPAHVLRDDSDLGHRLVTVGVGELTAIERRVALDAGRLVAERLLLAGRLVAAVLVLGDDWIVVGATPDALDLTPPPTVAVAPADTPDTVAAAVTPDTIAAAETRS